MKITAPIMICAASIAPNALHRIALKDSSKMNIACSRNGALPCRIGAWERRRGARCNFGAKGGRVLGMIALTARPFRDVERTPGMAAFFFLAATVCCL
jgi:hypothetical protein